MCDYEGIMRYLIFIIFLLAASLLFSICGLVHLIYNLS